ncbi:MAG: nucleoside triphosphate pyrophosphohydrolase [Porticoccaceae bacterium]|jgi:ATP diphosphatase|tara:strand:+ start:1000 stop:1803 length:804 start_codon:yes stop_codon:yes gene_type:complete
MSNYSIDDLRYLMSRLRDPQTGCPWDIKQNYKTIAPHTVEEVYEVIDAIERGDLEHLSEELGDLLFQIIFYTQLGAEDGLFDWDKVVNGITDKLVRRHPHVFPDGTLQSVRSANAVFDTKAINKKWEAIKQQERVDKGEDGTLADIPMALPSLSRAYKLQKRAASVGFDWTNPKDVLAKVKEEIAELEVEIAKGDRLAMEDEMGDLLFSCVNLARHLSIDPEKAMRLSSNKFKRRFEAMELLAAGETFSTMTAAEMESLWSRVKAQE